MFSALRPACFNARVKSVTRRQLRRTLTQCCQGKASKVLNNCGFAGVIVFLTPSFTAQYAWHQQKIVLKSLPHNFILPLK